jgi:hypothetical protein
MKSEVRSDSRNRTTGLGQAIAPRCVFLSCARVITVLVKSAYYNCDMTYYLL